jgi:membrane-associated phospholipid phosphatase
MTRFGLCYIGIALLLGSFALPFWETVDLAAFTFCNSTLKKFPTAWATFWACANHSLADWVEDGCILGFYALSVWKTPKGERKMRICQFAFSVVFTALIILLVNRLLCRDLLQLRRESPTLVFPHCHHLSELVPWLEMKEVSSKSFPGDHATTALLFATTYAFYAGKRLGLFAFIYAGFLCLPRLIAGAHWLSDLILGSGSIILFAISWLVFTPLGRVFPLWIKKMVDFRKRAA